MPTLTIVIGVLVTLLGPAFYFASTTRSGTAFIPSAFGVLILLCGLVALAGGGARKHALHVVAMVALLGTLAGLGMGVPALLRGNPRGTLGPYSQVALGVLCAALLVACVRSFVAARRARATGFPIV